MHSLHVFKQNSLSVGLADDWPHSGIVPAFFGKDDGGFVYVPNAYLEYEY